MAQAGEGVGGSRVEGTARAWIAESLGQGLGLSARVLAAVDPAAGEVWALAGPGSTPARLGAREALEEGVEGSFAAAVAALAAHLGGAAARGGRVLVIEDELSPPGDPALRDHADRVVLNGSEVFHWRAVTPALDAAALTELLGSATSGYPTNGFVVAADPHGWGPLEPLAGAEVAALAATVEAVLVAAYDAEGLLFWRLG